MTQIAKGFVQIPQGELTIDAYLARPEGDTPRPAVLVIQEVFGVNHHIQNVTGRIAREGYVAIAPAIYQRTAPGFATGYTPAELELGRSHAQQTTAEQLIQDLQATIDYLKSSGLTTGSIGCIGFCFGGHVAYLAATAIPEIKATASFYGAGIATRTPGGGPPTISRTKDIQGNIYIFFGTADPSIPLDQVEAIRAELQKYQINHQIFLYEGAEHGFFCDERPSYNPTWAAQAFEEVKALFAKELV
jgi:carboxymethylenebutenolidase